MIVCSAKTSAGLNLKHQTQLPSRKVTHRFILLSQSKRSFVSLIYVLPTTEYETEGRMYQAGILSLTYHKFILASSLVVPADALQTPGLAYIFQCSALLNGK